MNEPVTLKQVLFIAVGSALVGALASVIVTVSFSLSHLDEIRANLDIIQNLSSRIIILEGRIDKLDADEEQVEVNIDDLHPTAFDNTDDKPTPHYGPVGGAGGAL